MGIALVEDGKVSTTGSFGVTNTITQLPVTDETIFHTCSISKPVSAFLALSLCDQGDLDLGTALSRFIDLPPPFQNITARQVLCHTGGLPNWYPDLTERLKGGGVVREGFEPVAAPGERFLYSGEGYFWLQRVVEHLSGQDLDKLARSELFDPLGMTSASYIWRSNFEKLAASGHDLEDRPTDRSGPKRIHAFPNAAASLYATPIDILRFVANLMGSSRTATSVVETMLTPQVELDGGIGWSLGRGIEKSVDTNEVWYWHHGRGQFTNLVIWSRARRSGVAILTNTWRSDTAEALSKKIVGLLLPGEHPAFDWMSTRTMQAKGYLL